MNDNFVMSDLGELLRSTRDARGVTQQRLADMAGVAVSTIAKVEMRGTRKMHTQSVMLLAVALHSFAPLSDDELIGFAQAAGMKPGIMLHQLDKAREDRARTNHPRNDLYAIADRIADFVGVDEAEMTLGRLATAFEVLRIETEARIERAANQAIIDADPTGKGSESSTEPGQVRPREGMLLHHEPFEYEGMRGVIVSGHFIPETSETEPRPRAKKKAT